MLYCVGEEDCGGGLKLGAMVVLRPWEGFVRFGGGGGDVVTGVRCDWDYPSRHGAGMYMYSTAESSYAHITWNAVEDESQRGLSPRNGIYKTNSSNLLPKHDGRPSWHRHLL